ncbi:MAG TPA: squalene/phytoene synthase family protein [Longimicrobium sp.]|nr:squalene/phytoene synthase family protein [Longimicrobium sp.]
MSALDATVPAVAAMELPSGGPSDRATAGPSAASVPAADAPDRSADPLSAAREAVRAALRPLLAECGGIPRVELRGQLIRPLAAHASAVALGCAGDARVGFGALAVQLAHEASLVHDDIVDGAATRRGEPTLAATRGIGAALVAGDHLLAWAYRLAARTGSVRYAELFAEAVERTIAGEIAQGRAIGRVLSAGEYEAIALDKAGALLGCALAVAPAVRGRRGELRVVYDLGRALGLLYQRLDDLLDYCPLTDTGKPPLGDYAQRRWTWVLEEVPGAAFGCTADEITAALHTPGAHGTPLLRLLARLDAGFDTFQRARAAFLPGDTLLGALAEDWRARAHAAVRREREARAPKPALSGRREVSRRIRERVPRGDELAGYFARNSRSFSFAARFFPPRAAHTVARVYAYCRVTDDLVDHADGEEPAALEAVLDEWVELSRLAWQGRATGIELLDRVMGETAHASVPFTYAAELAEGMRMDLRRETYPTAAALRVYTHRVAGVVGMWLTELFGVRDAATLRRAGALGHAMQLTNILRDVGEDGRAGRVYLPAELMERHGITPASLLALCRGRGRIPIPIPYMQLLDELMREADESYARAFEAIPRLPVFFQRPVAVAAHVYRGIHRAIRRNGYDNLHRRARTTAPEKAVLAARALWELRAARRRMEVLPLADSAPMSLAAGGGALP